MSGTWQNLISFILRAKLGQNSVLACFLGSSGACLGLRYYIHRIVSRTDKLGQGFFGSTFEINKDGQHYSV